MSASDVAQDVRSYLLADTAVAAITSRCYVNVVPHTGSRPFIWIRRAGSNGAEVIGEADDEWQVRLDLEYVADDLDEASDLADAARERLEGTQGSVGDNTYSWLAVEDQYDDYAVVNQSADEHIEVVAHSLEVTLP